MNRISFRKNNQFTPSSLCFDIYSARKGFSKLFFLFTTLFLMTLAQQVFPDDGITINVGDTPIRIPRIETAVKIDAILDEEAWQKAVKINANIEVRPGENIPSPVKTEACLAYDRENLYVAIIAYDPEPSKIRAHISERDKIGSDDWVLILFDTFNDQQRTYDFMCNPLGIQHDMIETPNGNGEYDAIWDSDGRITDEGYIVEMAIPFNSLPFQNSEGDQIWGFDVVRSYPRTVRHHIGAFPRDRNNNCYMCQSLKLVGFKGVKPGKNLELDPTFSALITQERENITSGPFKQKERNIEPGITARWGITPNIMLSGTLNPDFSHVESDALQIDINTKFPLYYSEKRPFFLEGAEIFRGRFNLVHTRTLAEPAWGIKVTGKEGKHTLGFFSAHDRVTPLVFPGSEGGNDTTLSTKSIGTVLRYKYDVGESSFIGTTVTDREGDEYHNRLVSIDGELKFTAKDQFNFQAVASNSAYPKDIADEFDQPYGDFSGSAYRVNYDHHTDKYSVFARYEEVDPDFRADMGFMTRAGYDYNEIGGEYRWRQGPDHWYNLISIYAGHEMRRDSLGNTLHKVYGTQLYYNGPLESYFGIYSEFGKEGYNGKEYDADEFFVWGGITPNGSTTLNFEISAGDQIDYDNSRHGKQYTINPSIEQKIGRHFTLYVDHRFQKMTVNSMKLYDANVTNARLTYHFNRRTFLRVNLQHVDYSRNLDNYLEENRENFDANNRNLFTQLLFSYQINPQTVFYLGYSDNYLNRDYTDEMGRLDDGLIQTNRTFFTKIGYAWRL
ncbi:MAG: carbohydrate binding family 9 domain-containing protein [Deltaproteobacteria bacterium]|nr:carbohydrate binding family 9 domain-containing protein [Deltaproteobacteria bacterium]